MKIIKYFRGIVLLLAILIVPINYLCKDTNVHAATDEIYVNEQSGVDTNDGSEEAPVKTLANAMTKVNANGVINIESDISIASTVKINKNVTIQGISGNEEITWMGNSFTRHFTITGGYGLTIRQLTINGDTIGGGINVSSGNLTLIGVTLVNCSNNTNGGAIASTGGSNVNISDSIVQGNAVVRTNGYGGGIYSNAGSLVIQHSNILENTGDMGGAIGSYRNTNISIEDSTISNNIGAQGGGMYDYQTTDIITLKSTVLDNNKATITGGGIFVSDSKIELSGTTSIESNKVEIDTGHAGGGISLWSHSELVLKDNASINNNTADIGAGVGANGQCKVVLQDNAMILGNKTVRFGSHTNDLLGGGLYLYNECSLDVLGTAKIKDNEAEYGGGVYLAFNSVMNVEDNVEIDNNTAEINGGGILVYSDSVYPNGVLTLNGNVKIINNTAKSGDGGGIFLNKESKMKVQEAVVFQNNKAGRNGGAIYTLDVVDYDNLTTSDYQNITVDADTSFEGNQANGIYKAPEIVNSYNNINYRSTSVLNHPINNYDINYENQAREVYSITYYNVDSTEGYKKEYTSEDDSYILPTPLRNGYTFIHWLDEDNTIANELAKGSAGDKEYTAVWEKQIEENNNQNGDNQEEEDQVEIIEEPNMTQNEEMVTTVEKPNTVQEEIVTTGDHTNTRVFMIIMIMSVIGIIKIRKKRIK